MNNRGTAILTAAFSLVLLVGTKRQASDVIEQGTGGTAVRALVEGAQPGGDRGRRLHSPTREIRHVTASPRASHSLMRA